MSDAQLARGDFALYTFKEEVDSLRVLVVGREVMRFRRVDTLEDIENLRLIRNECREYMTHVTEEISQARQLLWWQGVAGDPKWRVWLVYVPGWEEPIGFVLLRKIVRERWYVTLGLRTWMRGQGFGTMIYAAMRRQAQGDEVWAVIREDNVASVRAAEKAGYERGQWAIEGQTAMVGGRP